MLFSNKVLRYFSTVALLAVPAAGDDVIGVEYYCCDSPKKCKTPSNFKGGCAAFYANPFPDALEDIRKLCPNNQAIMKYGCVDEKQIDDGYLFADYNCCEDDKCPEDCGEYYYGSVALADLETACEDATPVSDYSPVPPPTSTTTCRVIVAAFGGADPHFKVRHKGTMNDSICNCP